MKNTYKGFGLRIIPVLVSLLLCAPLFAEEVGTVVSTQGRVDIFKAGSEVAVPAREDESVSVGDSIRTKSGAKAEIAFKDKSILRLAQNSRVLIKDYSLDENKRRISAAIELSRGKARAIIEKMPDSSDFIITTPNAKGSVKGSDIVAFYQAGNSGMFVTEGKMSLVNFAHPEDHVTVNAGSAALVPLEELPKGPRPYLDAEKKVNEEDTNVPVSISKTGNVSIMKGAVAKVSGIVKIIPKGASEGRDANINDIVGEGDRIETGENGYIEIRLDNNNAINLKPNTKLSIIRLLLNPSTKEFENIFEVTIGSVKARIEGLKGNSKFEVKTPTAVCGARGTIIYVTVIQSATMSFFEGGGGYIINPLSGLTQNVGAGQGSTSDYTGAVSIPIYLSDSERQSYGEGWDGSAGYEGYSSPNNEGGTDLFGTGNSTSAGPVDTERAEQDLGYYFSGLPFSEVVSNLTSPGAGAQATNFSSRFGEVTTDYKDGVRQTFMKDNEESFVDGYFVFSLPSTPEWKGESTYSYTVGSYYNPGNNIFWTGDLQGTASDSGAYKGWIGGRFIDLAGAKRLDGKAFGIYIDPAGNAGTFSSYFADGVYGLGVFAGTGDSVEFTKRKSSIGMPPQDLFTAPINESRLEGKGRGRFSGGGTIYCDLLGGTSVSLEGERWGIWHIEAKGTYYLPTRNAWSLALGGKNVNVSDNSQSYWLGTMSSLNGRRDSKWESGGLENAFKGVYFDKDAASGAIHAGIIENGDILGYYSGTYFSAEEESSFRRAKGDWQAIGGGEWFEVTELLNEQTMFGENGINTLAAFVSVPITEAHSSLMTMSSCVNSNFTAANMDVRFYQNTENMRLWASQISGSYDTAPTNTSNWQIIMSNPGQDNVTIAGNQWNPDGTWHANIRNGTADSGDITFSGEAAGSHSDGKFNGVGAGIWQKED